MLVASIVAPAGKAAPQTGTSAGEPATSGGTPADDQPSFESVLAHEEHTPAPPALAAPAIPVAPQSAKADEAKKPADGAAPLVPAQVVSAPAAILAALLAAVAVPVAAAAKAADAATGSLGVARAPGSASVSLAPVVPIHGDERDARAPRWGQHSGDFANPIDPEKPDPRQLIGTLDALVPGPANRSDRSDRTDPTDPTGCLAVADQPVIGTAVHPAPHSGAPGLAAASSGAVPSLPAEATQSQAGAVASADPTPRGRASQSTPAVAGNDTGQVGDRAASQGSETLLHAVANATPLTARAVDPAPRPLLAEGAAKTAGEARNSADPARTAGDPRTSAGAVAEFTAPLAILLDTSGPKPSRDVPTSNQGPAPIADTSASNLDPTNLARPALGGGFAATTSTVGQGVGQWTSRANGDDHVAPASPFPMHNQAASFGLLEARPITRLPDPAGVAAPQQVIGATSGLSRSRSFHPASAGGPSANQTSPPEALQSQPVQASGTQGQSATAVSQTPLFPNGGAQPRPQIVAAHPAPTEPGGVSPDHHSAPSPGSDGSSVQSWANGAGTLPAAQHAQPATDTARSAPASQTGAVHQPIAQGIVVRQASLQMVGAVASFKVVLHPRSLGEVTVQVTRVQEGLQVTIAPQQLTTQTLLNKHLPDLLGTLRTGQDLPVQAQVVAPPTPASTPLGTPEAAAAGQSGLNFSANGGGQPFTGGQGGEQQQAWAGTMNDLLREPARINSAASPVARATAARMVGNPRIDVHA